VAPRNFAVSSALAQRSHMKIASAPKKEFHSN
jgi:hypothetical protein